MSLKIEWFESVPNKIEAGMMLRWHNNALTLVGHDIPGDALELFSEYGKAWGYLVKPHELDWIADMAGREAKARPEE